MRHLKLLQQVSESRAPVRSAMGVAFCATIEGRHHSVTATASYQSRQKACATRQLAVAILLHVRVLS